MTSQHAPKIEGSLKETINSIAFGLVGAVLIVNFGIAWIPNFFPWVMGVLVVVQLLLFLPKRAKPDYEKYVDPARRKGRHIIYSQTGQMVLEVSLESQESTHKARSSRIRDRFRKKGQKVGAGESFLEVPKDGRVRRRSSGSSDREQDVPSSKEERPVETPTLTNEDKNDNQEKERERNNEKLKEMLIETKHQQDSDKGEKEDEDEKEKTGYWRKRFHLGMSRN